MKLKKTVLAAAALALTLGPTAVSAELADDITLVSWGGAYQKSQHRAYVEPYIADNPEVTAVWDESSYEAVAKLRAMNEAGNVTWDLVDVVASDAIRLCDEGLAMEINHDELLAPAPDGTPASEDFGDLIVSDCFIPQIVYSTTFGYRTDMVGSTPPTDVCAVFDTEMYPGKRSLEKRPINNMEWALICDGVPKADVYDVLETEEGQARAFAKLDTIKDDVIWWSAGADTPQLLADGEVVIGSTYNGRLFSVIEEKDQPVGMLWDAQVFDLDGWIIPVGLSADRLARAKDFVRFATDTQRLADQAKYISYGPARMSSAPLVGQHADLGIDMAPHMPTDPENAKNTFLYNYEWWADYRDDLDAKFQAWLAQLFANACLKLRLALSGFSWRKRKRRQSSAVSLISICAICNSLCSLSVVCQSGPVLIPNQISNHRQERVRTSQHGPLSCGYLHDLPCLAGEPGPHLSDRCPDMLGAFEHAVGEVAVLQEREQRLDGVQLRTVGRQPEQGDVVGDLQFPGPVPARSVEDDEGMLARGNLLPDLPEMAAHLDGVGLRADMPDRGPGLRASRGEQVDVSVAVVPHDARARSLPCPDP